MHSVDDASHASVHVCVRRRVDNDTSFACACVHSVDDASHASVRVCVRRRVDNDASSACACVHSERRWRVACLVHVHDVDDTSHASVCASTVSSLRRPVCACAVSSRRQCVVYLCDASRAWFTRRVFGGTMVILKSSLNIRHGEAARRVAGVGLIRGGVERC
jgi:hypothetical protein